MNFEKALFFCSTKKTSDSDRIFFLIIQKIYFIISKLFYQLYSKLIIVDFHSECWKESIDIVIRKLNKDDYFNSESYRLIFILNCLDKLAEKIIAERLIYFAETADLLYFDQIDDRKQKSAIDAAISVLSDIEINKHKKKLIFILFMNIKKAFSNVNKSQLLETCCNFKLPPACISWVHSFLHDRKILLAFDNEKMNHSVDFNTDISQGSPVSSILWLIYISQLFKENHSKLTVRMPSYMNDIALVAASKSVHEKCQMLQKAAEQLINCETSHHIQFDMKKTELIHFYHSDKSLKKSVKIMKNRIFPQEIVRWLGVWFDRKLSFKYHVEKRIADT